MLLTIIAAIFFQISDSFWDFWGDGKAEISRYETTQNRYSEDRKADEILIFVTEPFNLEKQVKSDSYEEKDKTKAQVLKLNRVKDFQTGIYDYNLMTSIFTAIDPFILDNTQFDKGELIKITFTSQEWCGQVFHQLNRKSDGMQSSSYSYFEKQSDQQKTLEIKENTFFADNLFINVRELIKPLPEGKINIYPTLETVRVFHQPNKMNSAQVKKSTMQHSFEGKKVDATKININSENDHWIFIVEKAYPRKILFYEYKSGKQVISTGNLIKSVRLPYWQLNNNSSEKYLKELGY